MIKRRGCYYNTARFIAEGNFCAMKIMINRNYIGDDIRTAGWMVNYVRIARRLRK